MNEGGSDETLLSCPSVISRGSIETDGLIELVSRMQSNRHRVRPTQELKYL